MDIGEVTITNEEIVLERPIACDHKMDLGIVDKLLGGLEDQMQGLLRPYLTGIKHDKVHLAKSKFATEPIRALQRSDLACVDPSTDDLESLGPRLLGGKALAHAFRQ